MMESLENLTIRPEGRPQIDATGDLLSQVLAQIRLTGGGVFSCRIAADEALMLHDGEAHIVVVKTGTLRLEDRDQAPATIETGDLLLLPRGAETLRLIGVGPDVEIVLCRFWFDPESLRGMVFALPRAIHIRRASGADWIGGMLHFVMIETGVIQPGAALMISRIIDLMVIRTLRTWVQQGDASGWLGGLADARIANALKHIHENPLRRWSIDTLANQVGMSRSSFCERFTALVGCAPLRYQNEWRLKLARDMLTKRDLRVGEIGRRIGYESEAAFSRAYKQFFGHAPKHQPPESGISSSQTNPASS